ncbi:hypothetical protein KUTeg_002343 [Tegillarca granosa]|uniref:Uncharacterized protein n=1 Tax=Tegillarca granosa TaxID=220873 RepID=A0ABQ9FX99_TEGGR|nr:hypothetical protein KUTeg_002343 [Tegillarca granosa]
MKARWDSRNIKEEEKKEEKIVDDKDMEKWEKENGCEKIKYENGQEYFNFVTDGDKEKELAAKCLRLLLRGRGPLTPPAVKTPMSESVMSSATSASEESEAMTSGDSMVNSMSSSSASDLFKPNNPSPQIQLSKSCDSLNAPSPEVPDRKMSLPVKPTRPETDDENYVPMIEEIRVSPVVSRKGYLNFLEDKHSGWIKRWVVGVIL